MYTPSPFTESRIDVLHDFIRRNSFACIVTSGAEGIRASHVPVVLQPGSGPLGILQTHVARENPQWTDFASGNPVLAVFQGAHGYISPAWYTSAVSVPTWNYIVVHAHGRARIMEDDDRLQAHLRDLVHAHEPSDGGWDMEQLPVDFSANLRMAVVGVEIEIERIEGKWKLGQNRRSEDIDGAIAGLLRSGKADAEVLANEMALARAGTALIHD